MIGHVEAIFLTLIIFLVMAIAYFGWGNFAFRILGIGKNNGGSAFMSIWLGWAFSLLILQIVHFFVPITAYVTFLLFILGIFLSFPQILILFRRFYKNVFTGFGMLLTISMLVVSVWVAARSMLPATNYDSGLYYFNTIRWINSFPIVPGLGNLHGRLAFNQSFFTYVASLNFFPFFGHGRSLANSFLFLLLFASLLHYLVPAIHRPVLLAESHPFLFAPALFIFPILGYLALTSNGLSSPTPDLASSLIQFIMFVILARGITDLIRKERHMDKEVMVMAILAATAVTVKLSNLAFSAVIICISILYTWQLSHIPIRSIVRMLLPCFMVILVWGIRGFILSGAPFYPSTIGYIPVTWAVPIERVISVRNWIYSWARYPGPHWRYV